MSDLDQAQRLSVSRVVAALLVAFVGIAFAGYGLYHRVAQVTIASAAKVTDAAWFAPYVDTTLTPYFQFQDPSQNPSPKVVLGFVVSDPSSSCAPSWGAEYTLDQAANTLALDRRLAEYRAEGGDAIVSFGGNAHTELAVACTSTSALESAYESVISRYKLDTIDFDLEGTAVYDAASIQRRDQALVALQQMNRRDGNPLSIWLTLPVGPDGLAPSALELVAGTIDSGVQIAGVNVMTMDYGQPETSMLDVSEHAIDSTAHQLTSVFGPGIETSPWGVWPHLGSTVMVGVNDSQGETFSTEDAAALTAFASDHHMGRLSMWSLNRDTQCGASAFSYTGVLSSSCSGVEETTDAFSSTMSKFSSSQAASQAVSAVSDTPSDEPSNSPYPEWHPGPTYAAGYVVERGGYIYEAKWDNQGDDPLAVDGSSAGVWELLGPVLPQDQAPTTTTLPPKTYPQWTPTVGYQAGTIVLYSGLPYVARWYTIAQSPAAAAGGAGDSDWFPLYTVPGEPSPAP